MVTKNKRLKIRFYWYVGGFPEIIFKSKKPIYALFTMLIKKSSNSVH